MLRFLTRRTVFILCAFAGLSCCYRLWAQGGLTPPPRPGATTPISNGSAESPLTLGETLSYNIGWSTYPTAARLDLEVVDRGAYFGQDGFELRTKIETTPSIRSLFLDLDSEYTTYVGTTKLLPYRLENSIRQGARRSDETIILDQAGRTVRFGDDKQINAPSELYDLTSLLYALRLQTFSPGTKQKFTAIYGQEIFEIEAEGRERERVTTQIGAYEAIGVSLDGKTKKTNLSKYRIKIWFSNDARRIPVLMTGRLPFGDLRVELANMTINQRPKQIIVKEKIGEGPKGPTEIYTEVERGRPFSVGERLNYDVSWSNFASIGKASFAVRQRGRIGSARIIELVGEASTTGAARSLIDVDDQMISFVEVNSLVPVRSEIRLHEGARIKETIAEYKPDSSVRLNNGTHFKVQPQTLDLVSVFYNLRAADLKLGQIYNYRLLDANHRPANLIFKVIKQERIGGPLGSQDALQMDVYSNEQKQVIAQVWLSNDVRRLPLYLAIRTRFGEIRFQLSSVVSGR
jgi:hypothetical protein